MTLKLVKMVNKLGKRDTYEDDYKPRIIKHKLSSSNETRNKTQFSNWPATKPTHTHTHTNWILVEWRRNIVAGASTRAR